MTLAEFRKLKKRDFDNGAVLDDIERVIESREALQEENARLRKLLKDDPTEHCATACDWCAAWSAKRRAALGDSR